MIQITKRLLRTALHIVELTSHCFARRAVHIRHKLFGEVFSISRHSGNVGVQPLVPFWVPIAVDIVAREAIALHQRMASGLIYGNIVRLSLVVAAIIVSEVMIVVAIICAFHVGVTASLPGRENVLGWWRLLDWHLGRWLDDRFVHARWGWGSL